MLQGQYDASLAAIPDGPAKAGGIAVGDDAAGAMLDARADDGRSGPFTFVFGTTPGVWRPSPPLLLLDPAPWVGNVTPFLLPSAAMVGTDGPNRAHEPRLRAGLQGGEVARLADEHDADRRPDDGGDLLAGPAGSAVRRRDANAVGALRAEHRPERPPVRDGRLAAADGAIGCWYDKYKWNFWRPIDAIHGAGADGNRATRPDPSWKALFDPATATMPPLSTPGFPDHPSGHSCVSSATLGAMRDFFGRDRIAFDITSSRFPNQPRHYESFSDALQEVVDARVWGGIHFRTADTEGAELGSKVARWERKHYFQRVRSHHRGHGGD